MLPQLQKLPGKGDGEWGKKCLLHRFGADPAEDRSFVEKKKNVLGRPIARATSYCLLPWQTHSDYGPPKMPLKLAV